MTVEARPTAELSDRRARLVYFVLSTYYYQVNAPDLFNKTVETKIIMFET